MTHGSSRLRPAESQISGLRGPSGASQNLSALSRQEALERHGLVVTPDGIELTLSGLQKASRRAVDLRAQGNREAASVLALDPSDPRRWEFMKCLALDSFSREPRSSLFK